jgi:hypothetical protein
VLRDWYQFESVILPTLETAHRFTVLLPFRTEALPSESQRRERLALARRVIDLERPAHTTFDVQFYWALFRVGEARLGTDSLIDLGGRDPALLPQSVLGQIYLAETRITAGHPLNVSERQVAGRDRLR